MSGMLANSTFPAGSGFQLCSAGENSVCFQLYPSAIASGQAGDPTAEWFNIVLAALAGVLEFTGLIGACLPEEEKVKFWNESVTGKADLVAAWLWDFGLVALCVPFVFGWRCARFIFENCCYLAGAVFGHLVRGRSSGAKPVATHSPSQHQSPSPVPDRYPPLQTTPPNTDITTPPPAVKPLRGILPLTDHGGLRLRNRVAAEGHGEDILLAERWENRRSGEAWVALEDEPTSQAEPGPAEVSVEPFRNPFLDQPEASTFSPPVVAEPWENEGEGEAGAALEDERNSQAEPGTAETPVDPFWSPPPSQPEPSVSGPPPAVKPARRVAFAFPAKAATQQASEPTPSRKGKGKGPALPSSQESGNSDEEQRLFNPSVHHRFPQKLGWHTQADGAGRLTEPQSLLGDAVIPSQGSLDDDMAARIGAIPIKAANGREPHCHSDWLWRREGRSQGGPEDGFVGNYYPPLPRTIDPEYEKENKSGWVWGIPKVDAKSEGKERAEEAVEGDGGDDGEEADEGEGAGKSEEDEEYRRPFPVYKVKKLPGWEGDLEEDVSFEDNERSTTHSSSPEPLEASTPPANTPTAKAADNPSPDRATAMAGVSSADNVPPPSNDRWRLLESTGFREVVNNLAGEAVAEEGVAKDDKVKPKPKRNFEKRWFQNI